LDGNTLTITLVGSAALFILSGTLENKSSQSPGDKNLTVDVAVISQIAGELDIAVSVNFNLELAKEAIDPCCPTRNFADGF
jgi:hypothetical protein